MPSHLRPRPGTASAVGRSSIGRLVGSQCNFDQSSIVARMSSRAMQNGRSWVKKRNLGQKNETRAEKTGFSALFLSVSIERGGGIRKNFLGLANNSFAPHRWFSGNRLASSLKLLAAPGAHASVEAPPASPRRATLAPVFPAGSGQTRHVDGPPWGQHCGYLAG